MRLVLVGLRGAGKSSAGRAASEILGVPFADLDALIEARGRTIPEIFAAEGEAGFRRLEAEELLGLALPEDALLATGGGAVLRPECRARLGELGTVVYLYASPETLAVRVAGTDRPRLHGEDALEESRHLLAERGPLYEGLAAHRIDSGALSEAEVARELVALYRRGTVVDREPDAATDEAEEASSPGPDTSPSGAAGGTRRQQMVALLGDGAITVPELGELLGVPVRIVVDDLEHLRRSLGDALVIEPAECSGCHRIFRDRTRFTRPSRCPSCRSERVSWPRVRVR